MQFNVSTCRFYIANDINKTHLVPFIYTWNITIFKIILLPFIHVHVCITVVEIAGHNPHNTAGYVNFFATIATIHYISYETKTLLFFTYIFLEAKLACVIDQNVT